jgi:uncharacterized protein YjbI with pentapeptide repeats
MLFSAFLICAAIIIFFISKISISWDEIVAYMKEGGGKEGIPNYIIIRTIGLGIISIIGMTLAAWRSKSLERQATIAEQGHITERIIKATEQLGSQEMAVRIGGIYSLWRTAMDSPLESDKRNILDILCAFIRMQRPNSAPTQQTSQRRCRIVRGKKGIVYSKKLIAKPNSTSHKNQLPLADDTQIALSLIGRRYQELKLKKKYNPNLSGAYLASANGEMLDLFKANLQNTNLQDANLFGADIRMADMSGANLNRTQMGGADLRLTTLKNVKMQQADLTRANLAGANLEGGHLQQANMTFANCQKANMTYANLHKAKLINTNLQNASVFMANLQEANLQLADLQRADLTKTNLNSANLAGANLSYASFFETTYHNADFRGATLPEGFSPSQSKN